PASGGVTSLQLLRVLDRFPEAQRPAADAAFFHLFAEVMKACWQRRLAGVGGTDDAGEGAARHLADEMVDELQREGRAGPAAPARGTAMAEAPARCTSHLCAADAAGNLVALTQTHGAAFGSWLSVPGTGLILGHGMMRFDPRPGWPNSVAPGKSPLHNMAPFL